MSVIKNRKKLTNIRTWIVFGAMLCGFIVSIILSIEFHVFREVLIAANCMSGLFSMLFALVLYAFCGSGRYQESRQKRLFEMMVTMAYFISFFSTMGDIFQGYTAYIRLLEIFVVLSYAIQPVYWTVFWIYQRVCFPDKENRKILLAFVIIYHSIFFVAVISNFWVDLMFKVNSKGLLEYSDIINIIFVWGLGWGLFYLIYIYEKKCEIKEKLTLSVQILFPACVLLLAVILIQVKNVVIEELEGIFNIIYLVPLYIMFFNIYAEQNRQLLLKEKALTESRLNAMALQINPHFIYNTLGSIASLCGSDPDMAAELTYKFSDYLRESVGNTSGSQLISLEQEIEHLKVYLSIEQVRFPNIKIEYDLRTVDFLIPALSVQPLVENAIKHGVCKRRRSEGTVRIESFEGRENYVVRVTDNGVGFSAMPDDGRKHLGIENIRTRLKILCNGTLDVSGTENVGAVSTIFIPKAGKQ